MIGYAMVGTNDLAKAKAFYDALFGEMGAKVLMDVGRAAFYGTPARRITPAVGANAYAREARKEGWEVVDHALAPRAEFFHFLLLFMRRAG